MFLVLAFVILFIVLLWYTINKSVHEGLVSVGGFNYVVSKEDGQHKANILHKMNGTAIDFIILLRRKIATQHGEIDDRVKKIYERLRRKYDPDTLQEAFDSILDPSRTSYTLNKGEEMHMCLKIDDVEDEWPIFFLVLMHELAHVASEGTGHGKEFWDNYDLMMKIAVMEGWTANMILPDESVLYCDKIRIGMNEIKRLKPETYLDR